MILYFSLYFLFCDKSTAGVVKLVEDVGERRVGRWNGEFFNVSCAGWLSGGRRGLKIDSASCGLNK